jgi:hypothetical protein
MSIPAVAKLSVDFCHFVTLPVIPVTVRLDGVEPEQMVWRPEAFPPFETVETIICKAVEILLQPPDDVILLYHVVAVSG